MKIRSLGRTANEPELLTVTFEFEHPADSSQLLDHLYTAMKERLGVWIEYDNDPAGIAEAEWQSDIIIEGEVMNSMARNPDLQYVIISIPLPQLDEPGCIPTIISAEP